jgi:MoaA/NifB/PqqE/SkfB family radical SAM enzyme
MYVNSIQRLQVDLVSSCNASCLFCSRQAYDGEINQHFPRNKKLSLVSFDKVLKDKSLKNLKEIFFCGNYGDALACSNLTDYLDLIEKNIHINIHTNGSLGTVGLWKSLGQKLNVPNRFVKFSIDGLEDTNSIYRRGVSWTKIIENAEVFIANGGRAVWKFIVFDHNKHQIKQAEDLSKKMGFVRFEVRKNYSPDLESFLFQSDSLSLQAEKTQDFLFTNTGKSTSIHCAAISEQSIYLDFDGRIWPCCWIPDWKYSPTKEKRQWHQKKIESVYGEKFNNVDLQVVENIVQSEWFYDLKNSWKNTPIDKNKIHPSCIKFCGQCKSE